ncbi:unnamed protein product [Phytomonas sp. EM1]|nr:unnamed protein product [Phytomonas sp. EM1]|eukprot:CCW59528.1 unnamed protein product [Phytomonas sp. isolate EM1]
MILRKLSSGQLRRLSLVSLCMHPISMCLAKRASSTHPSDLAHTKIIEEENGLFSSKVSAEKHEEDEEFDELEAGSQEVHDLCFAIIGFLRRADPAASDCLFERRTKRRFREPIPEHKRRLLHTHGDRSYRSLNSFKNESDFKKATQLYVQFCEKLLHLLNKPLMDRLIESVGRGYKDWRRDGVHRYRRLIERASWNSFPHRWFKHSPFEVQQLRADIPESAVRNTRFYRDHATICTLFTLIEAPHPYQSQIERHMFQITSNYDPIVRSSNVEGKKP